MAHLPLSTFTNFWNELGPFLDENNHPLKISHQNMWQILSSTMPLNIPPKMHFTFCRQGETGGWADNDDEDANRLLKRWAEML
jgi:hypothetical protein